MLSSMVLREMNELLTKIIGKVVELGFMAIAISIANPRIEEPPYLKEFEKLVKSTYREEGKYLEEVMRLLEKARVEEKCAICKERINIALKEVRKTDECYKLMKKMGYNRWSDVPKEVREEILMEVEKNV